MLERTSALMKMFTEPVFSSEMKGVWNPNTLVEICISILLYGH